MRGALGKPGERADASRRSFLLDLGFVLRFRSARKLSGFKKVTPRAHVRARPGSSTSNLSFSRTSGAVSIEVVEEEVRDYVKRRVRERAMSRAEAFPCNRIELSGNSPDRRRGACFLF